MTVEEKTKTQQRATYVTLIGIFTTLLSLFSLKKGRQWQLKPFDLVLLSLASYRAGHLIAFDKVTEPLRQPFTKVQQDPSGAGDTVVPKEDSGAKKALGELLACPTCVGTWVAAFLTYGLMLVPGPTRVLLAILSSTGVAEWLHSSNEALKWNGQLARNRAGSGS
jgi:hypothetical protein